ncbi:PREDICTED: sterol 3-beta-glucosyltransferase UGT80B1 isoform X2 [Nelumbo nucifera]|uniref:Sterol 3-beta-glucosyltransferase UGT80B1 isoform X2 n=1 Tax=Nelumbo nucifera TaxID=4432 RepID=A0A1U8A3V0_NELNU|nr:PREDICTED: sterol 3-beta-glucosyltransferase UGT80B1 isoform X2 [Nelumbo nucifera]
MEEEENTRTPRAVFMAFGTKGDVNPIVAIAAAFAIDQRQYHVVLITHSAHKNLSTYLAANNVTYFQVSTPPVLSAYRDDDASGSVESLFSMKKKLIAREHRQECLSIMEMVFGDDPKMDGDFILINFFALEGWNLAELFQIRCIVAAPYVVPYSAPSSFERRFKKEFPLLYKYLQESPVDQVCWKDVIHWMWPLFTEEWGSWRSMALNLSPCPFTDPVTGLPTWHDWPRSPLLLYGFSKEVVECPGYWPSRVRVCGFWFLPEEWQYSCNKCRQVLTPLPSGHLSTNDDMCLQHANLHWFLKTSKTVLPIFVGLSSIGSMGFLTNPGAFLQVLEAVMEITGYRFILLTAGFEPLDAAIQLIATKTCSLSDQKPQVEDGILLFSDHLLCFSGTVPYNWLFQRCAVAIHHGGSGSTAAALHAGIPQFYWAEKMFWLGVAPEPLQRNHLVPDRDDDVSIVQAANGLSNAISYALSPKVKACASEVAERISSEDGVGEAVKILKEEVMCQSKIRHQTSF